MGNRRVREWPARRLGGIAAAEAVHVVQELRLIVVRRQRVVVDRPRRRHAVLVLQRLEILAPQAIEHAAPELGVAADAVVRVGKKLDALRVEPALSGPIAQVLPDGLGIPVVGFLRHGPAALEHEHPRRRLRQRACHRPAAGAAADDDDVEVRAHCQLAAGVILAIVCGGRDPMEA